MKKPISIKIDIKDFDSNNIEELKEIMLSVGAFVIDLGYSLDDDISIYFNGISYKLYTCNDIYKPNSLSCIACKYNDTCKRDDLGGRA